MEVENHLNWTEGLINAIDYIETHLIDGEVLDQNTIARQAYSSPDNFRKVFHLITGYTIGEYIRNRRLSLAGEELISSNRSVTDIALEYGYDTPESFTKAFTRFHGNSRHLANYDVIRKRDLQTNPDSFLHFIVDNLIPYLEEIYSVNPENMTLTGHSLGGYWAYYALFHNDTIGKNTFTNYYIGSPSMWANTGGKFISTYEDEYYSRTQTLNANVYVTVGADEDKNFIFSIENFYNDLQGRNYSGLNLTYEKIEGYDHNTVFKPSIKNTLLMFYKKDSE